MDIKKRILLIILMFVMYFIVHYGAQYWNEYSNGRKANAVLENIKEEAKKEYPNETEMLAIQKIAVRRAEEYINTQGSFDEKRKNAADVFFGFYLINVRARMEYCRDLNVDISLFSNLFKETYKKEYLVAKKVRKYSLLDIDNLYGNIQSVMTRVIKKDMESLAAGNRISLSESCQLLVDEAPQIISSMHMSVSNPAVYSVLMSNN